MCNRIFVQNIPLIAYLLRSVKVLVREKQKTEEVNRLQEVIQKLLHDAGTKTKLEVGVTLIYLSKTNRMQSLSLQESVCRT